MFFSRNSAPVAWIAAFLGNPGARYENTRHNAGYFAAEVAGDIAGVRINRAKFRALTSVARIGDQGVFLMKPQTYMNLSGTAVSQAMRFYRIPLSNVIVISDDVSMPTGKLRVRRQGSSGGHNGLKDIIAKCGGEGFPRIKIGVGPPPSEYQELADWVLSKLSGEDLKLITEASSKAVKALEMIVTKGIDSAMAEFN